MKNAKKALILVLCAALLVGASVMGTLAYLTSQTETITNTMSVGNVKITMGETDVDLYGVKDSNDRVIKNDYKLIPGHTYTKDPTIYVDAQSESCWLFVKITNNIEAIEGGTTISTQLAANGWTKLAGTNDIWAYSAAVGAGAEVPVFSTFTIAGTADLTGYAEKTVEIIGYAVQRDGFDTAAAAWGATFGKP